MKITIFYSWQSDLPKETNRGLIEDALNDAIKSVQTESEIKLDLRLDSDTRDIPGTPDIVQNIFDKIRNSGVFVGDVSIINSGSKGKPCPNPNVLLELGYAARHLGWNNIICVFNLSYGQVEDLPFDLRVRRILRYESAEEDHENRIMNDKLRNELQEALQLIIKSYDTVKGTENTRLKAILEELEYNADLASYASTNELGRAFQVNQYQRAIKKDVVLSLGKGLKKSVINTYAEIDRTNILINAAINSPLTGNAKAIALNKASEAIVALRPEIESTRKELEQFLSSNVNL